VTVPPVISNSSPLIVLTQIGHLDLLEKLFAQVLVPPAVVRETLSVVLPKWIIETSLTQSVGPRVLRASLGPGESEALSLALEVNPQWIILDDRPARRLAAALGLPVIGTLGVLLAGKRRGFLSAIRPCVDALVNIGFRIAPDLYERVLGDAGEQ
jgi:uncharacterized protein